MKKSISLMDRYRCLNDSELCDLIHLISNRFSKFILVGDFNFNDID